MAVLLAFAFVSGIITILSPCILPVLPIVLSGSVGGGKARPFGVLAGFVVSFTVFTLTLSALVQAIGIPPDALRIVAVVLIVLFGAVMLVPRLRDRFELLASRVARLGLARRAGPPGVHALHTRAQPSSRRHSGIHARRATPAGTAAAVQPGLAGLWSGVPVGLSLGLVWTPCVGPIMASVISLAVTQRIDGGSVFITLAYTLGTSIPMLAVMLGGRALLNRVPALVRHAAAVQKGFGVLMILVGVAVGLGWDRRFQAAVLAAFPGYGAGLTALEEAAPVREALQARGSAGDAGESLGSGAAPLMTSGRPSDAVFAGAPAERPEGGVPGDYGRAPPLVAGGPWFNTEGNAPLTLESLRGKVVLVDFWTYSCINCVRTIPYLQAWHEAYRDRGLVIIGVHTPEFAFEKSPDNVQRAMRDLGVDWPVVLDNDYRQWRAYRNLYWPAHYFIDAEGRVRYFHFGEGRYAESERVIQALLKEAGRRVGGIVAQADPRFTSRTPETYLGYRRAKGLISAAAPARDKAAEYRPAGVPGNGEWSLAGTWTVTSQYVVPESSGVLELGFHARHVFLVVEPEAPGGRIEVQVDGRPAADTADVKGGVLAPDGSRVYQLVGLEEPGGHVLRLEVTGRLRLFAFTFG